MNFHLLGIWTLNCATLTSAPSSSTLAGPCGGLPAEWVVFGGVPLVQVVWSLQGLLLLLVTDHHPIDTLTGSTLYRTHKYTNYVNPPKTKMISQSINPPKLLQNPQFFILPRNQHYWHYREHNHYRELFHEIKGGRQERKSNLLHNLPNLQIQYVGQTKCRLMDRF